MVALLPGARHARELLEGSTAELRQGEAAEAERVLREEFDSPYARYAVLVLSGVPPPDTPDGRLLLDEALGTLDVVPFVTRTYSPRNLLSTVIDNSSEGPTHRLDYGYDGRGVRVSRAES